ncbi:MAG TPA: hypothetical protein VIW24_11555 [Aldersonia sp.]
MGNLFAQTWIWIAIAFVLGLAIGFALAWVLRKKKVEVTEERIAGTPGGAADRPTPLYVGDGRRAGTLGAATTSSSGGRHAAPDPDETIRRTPAEQDQADAGPESGTADPGTGDQPPPDDTSTGGNPVEDGDARERSTT